MKEYPSIYSARDLLTKSKGYEGRSFIAFDKLDGSNIRAEWSRKRGWYKFGSRRQLIDASHPLLGGSVKCILDTYGDAIPRVLKDDTFFGNPQEITCYFEYFGPHSFAGQHDEASLCVENNNPKKVVVFDVNINKKGFVDPANFVSRFGPHMEIPRVIGEGELTEEFIARVRADEFNTPEGVILKGGEGHSLWFSKIKTQKYLDRLKEFFGNDWEKHGE